MYGGGPKHHTPSYLSLSALHLTMQLSSLPHHSLSCILSMQSPF